MADQKISQLTVATTPLAGTELVPVVQGAVTKQVTVSDLTAGRTVLASALGLGMTPTTQPLEVAGAIKTSQAGNLLYLNPAFGGGSDPAVQSAANNLVFCTLNNERMRIDNAGSVGIGILPQPGYGLAVATSIGVNGIGPSNDALLSLSAEGGRFKHISLFTLGSTRWDFGANNSAETGTNVGTDFYINAFSDTGAYLYTSLFITRSTNAVNINGVLNAAGGVKSYNAVKVLPPGNGGIGLSSAFSNSNSGYVELFDAAATPIRVGYIGFVPLSPTPSGQIQYNSETGGGHHFNVRIDCDGPIKTGVYTVATLPSAAAVGGGARAWVSDSNTISFGSAVAGGGTFTCPVNSNSANWFVG